MTNKITLTENESVFLEMVRDADDNGKDFIFKTLLCAVRFGEEFFNDTKEYVEHKDGHTLYKIVEQYFSRLETEKVNKSLSY